MLTILLPTRNRASHCAAQLRFLRSNGIVHPVVIADSSDPEQADRVRHACTGLGEYRHLAAELRLADKLVQVINTIETPFTVITPDDDVALPHAIEAALSFLQRSAEFVAAHGYVLDFVLQGNDVDIYAVSGFTPPIDDDEPLRRHYHLMRRYQPFYWAVFRTAVLATAVRQAAAIEGIMFRELTVMSLAVLQGKIARLPIVYSLRGTEPSHTPITESDPLFWFLRDAPSFFRSYWSYRNALARHIHSTPSIAAPPAHELDHLLDVVHATFLGRALDLGMTNYTARRLLGDPLPPVMAPTARPGWREPADDDLVHFSTSHDRRYVWRKAVMGAEPRDEIAISPNQIMLVEQELEHYHLECI